MHLVRVKDEIINKRARGPGSSLRSIPELSENKLTLHRDLCPRTLTVFLLVQPS